MNISMAVGFLTLLLVPASARAQCGTTALPDLLAPVPTAGDFFGETVRTDGTRVIVGAYGHDALGTDSGTAYVYRLDAGTWVHEAQLLAPDGAAMDHFARSAAVDGEHAIVGAYQDDDGGSRSGSAYFYRRTGTTWTFQQKVIAPDPGAADRFGRIVAVRGDVAVAGAPFDADIGVDGGSAYVYRWDGASWNFEQKLLPSDGGANDRFGKTFALAQDLIITGASIHNLPGAPEAGSGYAFRWNGTIWIEEAALVPPTPQTNERMGVSTAVDGMPLQEVAVVGSSDWDDGALTDCGTAYVFRRGASGWEFEQQLVASDRAAQDSFGWTVAIEGDTILVGSVFADLPGATNAGATYVFRKQGATWVEVAKLVAATPEHGENAGASIALAGGHAFLGANKAGGDTNSGRVLVFDVLAPCIEPFCMGDGSGTACPCGNESAVGSGAGCTNSLGLGGRLTGSGNAQVSADSLVLAGASMPDSSALYFQGETQIASGAGSVFGDGLRCAGSPALRLGTKVNSGGASSYPTAGDLPVSVKGSVPAGATRYYQVRYRNSAAFCTAEVFNQTNGLRVVWAP